MFDKNDKCMYMYDAYVWFICVIYMYDEYDKKYQK